MAGIRGINHITLISGDLDRSVTFYRDVLGAGLRARWASGAYLDLGGLWLCLEAGTPDIRRDHGHIALDCATEDFTTLARTIDAAAPRWKENRSEGESLYFLDPDGHRLELHCGTLDSRLQSYADRPDITMPAPS